MGSFVGVGRLGDGINIAYQYGFWNPIEIYKSLFKVYAPVKLREVTKNNPPILLAFWPVFFVAARGEYFNMHLLPRLEYEPKFGAIMGGLFLVTSLSQIIDQTKKEKS